ncbi:hypothetical protein ACHAWF_003358, partial [Thalassiosira exigua]
MAPAPTIANFFVALHEMKEVLPWLQICVLYVCRFIDDGFGIWLHHDNPAVHALLWKSFQAAVNNGGLRWEFTERSHSVDFMDVTIYIEKGRLEMNLFEKKTLPPPLPASPLMPFDGSPDGAHFWKFAPHPLPLL